MRRGLVLLAMVLGLGCDGDPGANRGLRGDGGDGGDGGIAGSAGAEEAPGRRPHILLIVAEDLGPRLGAYGDPLAVTPNLDALAGQGVRFERAFTTAGVCAPSRAAIIMGVHQNRFGAGHMRTAAGGYVAVPDPDWKAFPETLRAAGYYAINNGKTDYQMSTTWGGARGGPSTIWDEESAGDWSGRPPGKPFFAYLTLHSTHESQVWPTWHLGGLMPILMAPTRIAHHWQWPLETDPAQVRVPAYYPDTPTVRRDLARHYNNVARLDEQVGQLLARLEAEGIADETLVIFTTDHGDGLPRAKRWLYDSGTRVPLVVRWPDGRDAGTTSEELVSLVDLAPTILAAAGIERPAHYEGRVFFGLEKELEPDFVFMARDRVDEQPDRVRAVRDRRYRLIRHGWPAKPYVLDVGFRDQMPMMQELRAMQAAGELVGPPALWFRPTRDAIELFDTERDPDEVENLADRADHAGPRERLIAALDRWEKVSEDLGFLDEAELRERFWPGGIQPQTAAPEIAHLERVPGTHAVTLQTETKGASMSYRFDGGPANLYTHPLAAPSGTTIEARAVRYGWAESEWARVVLP